MTRVVLAQGGELDIATIPRLMARIEPYREPGWEVVLDLREVTLMDCYSLGHILASLSHAATEGWSLRLLVESAPVLRLLDLTGAAGLLPLGLPAPA
jgi:anti-anti-sigma factor